MPREQLRFGNNASIASCGETLAPPCFTFLLKIVKRLEWYLNHGKKQMLPVDTGSGKFEKETRRRSEPTILVLGKSPATFSDVISIAHDHRSS